MSAVIVLIIVAGITMTLNASISGWGGIGPTGASLTGMTGNPGPHLALQPTGNTGPTGRTGPTGLQGSSVGPRGDQGQTGATGPTGIVGFTGPPSSLGVVDAVYTCEIGVLGNPPFATALTSYRIVSGQLLFMNISLQWPPQTSMPSGLVGITLPVGAVGEMVCYSNAGSFSGISSGLNGRIPVGVVIPGNPPPQYLSLFLPNQSGDVTPIDDTNVTLNIPGSFNCTLIYIVSVT
jgi:hypothetical protein